MPFSQPSIGPVSNTEATAFEEFETNLKGHYYASAIGWIVSLQKDLVGSKQKIQNTKEELLAESGTMKIRNMTGWALTLFFLEQVWKNLSRIFYLSIILLIT